jgi:hypothetical protein
MLNKISPVSDKAGHRIRTRKRESDGGENGERVEERRKEKIFGTKLFSANHKKYRSHIANKRRLISSSEVDYNKSDVTGLLFM